MAEATSVLAAAGAVAAAAQLVFRYYCSELAVQAMEAAFSALGSADAAAVTMAGPSQPALFLYPASLQYQPQQP